MINLNAISNKNRQRMMRGGGGSALLLDTYTAAFAYSMRLLTTTYSGPLIRVRRSSDNAEKDFYPDSNNELTGDSEDGASTTFSSWISGTDGFGVTWYDQIGSQDVDQSLTNRQPRIAVSGTITTSGSKTALEFEYSGALDATYFTTATITAMTQPFTFTAVVDWRGNTGNPGAVANYDNAQAYTPISSNSVGNLLNSWGVNLSHADTWSYPTKAVHYSMANGSSSELTWNTQTITTGDAGTNNTGTSAFAIGTRSGGNRGVDGFIQELIGFDADMGDDWTAIRDDMNAHFGAY